MIGFHDDEPPQLPPGWACGKDTWQPGERWYFVRGYHRVEPYCQNCVPAEQRDAAVFVQNGPINMDIPATKERRH